MALKSPIESHGFWGATFASGSDLPNVAGAATQDAALEAGDRAWVTGAGGSLWACVDPTLGAAVWQQLVAGGTATVQVPIENGATINAYDCVAAGPTLGRCVQMDASGAFWADYLGVALVGGSGNGAGTVFATVAVAGKVTDPGATFTQGPLFAPDGTGRPTNTPPPINSAAILRIGWAYSATEYILHVGEGTVPGNPIFEWADFTFTRSSEGALADPRWGWDFKQRVTMGEALSYALRTTSLLEEVPVWTPDAGGSVLGGQADPRGGTAADTFTDSTAISVAGAKSAAKAGAYTSGNDFWLSGWLKKDAGAGGYCGVYVYSGAGTNRGQFDLDPRTGQIGNPVAFTTLFVQEFSGWYFFAARHPGYVAADMPWSYVYPAKGSVFGTPAVAAQGSATFYGLRIVDATAIGDLLANPTPWAAPGEPRFMPDGNLLIEGSRTNRNDLGSGDLTGWAHTITTAALDPPGPDRSLSSATRLTDADPASYAYSTNVMTVVPGTAYVFRCKVKKDNDESRYPCIQVSETVNRAVQINTRTGAVVAILGAFDNVEVYDAGDFWLFCGDWLAVGAAATIRLHPAYGVVWGVASPTAVGSATFASVQLEAVGTATPSAPSSLIRTVSAPAVRQPELLYRAALTAAEAAVFENPNGFWWDVWYEEASTDVTAVAQYDFTFAGHCYMQASNPGGNFRLRNDLGLVDVAMPRLRGDHLRIWVKLSPSYPMQLKVWNLRTGALATGTAGVNGLPLVGYYLSWGSYSPAPTNTSPKVISLPIAGHP